MTRKTVLTLTVAIVLFLSACVPIQDPATLQAEEASAPAVSAGENAAIAPRIDVAGAKQHHDDGTAIFVDARSEEDYHVAHIAGAIRVSGDPATLGDTLPKEMLIITYCT